MKNQLKSYEDFKKEYYENERIEEIINYITSNNKELQQALNHSEIIFNKLMKSLNEEQQHLLLKYDEAQNEIFSSENHFIAKQIYKDLVR